MVVGWILLLLSPICHGAFVRPVQPNATRSFLPRAYPLAVRSAYLNAWYVRLDADAGGDPNALPIRQVHRYLPIDFSGVVRVDGEVYTWLGNDVISNTTRTTLKATEVTPTRTIFTVEVASKVEVKATFLSPIEPSDLVKQSFPFSYVALDLRSLDGAPHEIQVYVETGLILLSSNYTERATWSTVLNGRTMFHEAHLQSPSSMSERDGFAQDSTMYLASPSEGNSTWQSGGQFAVRTGFRRTGRLDNTADTNFRALDDDLPALANAVDLGLITSSSQPVVFALGLVRDPVISYETETGQQLRRSYFWTKYSNIADAINDFLGDFGGALDRAVALDNTLIDKTESVSEEYTNLISLAARQTMTMDITVSEISKGNLNSSDVQIFMKDTGVTRRINSVEGIYAALPAMLYFNPAFVGYALEPLLRYQSSALYSNDFSGPDLGLSYPLAAEPSGTSARGIESTSKMIILVWAHAIYSGDGSLLAKHTPLLERWANFLLTSTASTRDQSIDGVVKNNSTNLLLGAAFGLHASAKILSALGIDSARHNDLAKSTMDKLASLTRNSNGHFMSTNDPSSSPGLIYNLYIDRLLKFSLVNNEIYEAQSAHYLSLLSSTNSRYGIPIDGDSKNAKPHWTMFAAACSNDPARAALVKSIHARANTSNLVGIFPSSYNVDDGATPEPRGGGNPEQGAMFAILALGLNTTDVAVAQSGPKSPKSQKAIQGGAIAGIVVGSLAAIGLLVGITLLVRRRRRVHAVNSTTETFVSAPFRFHDTPVPPPAASQPTLQPVRSHTGQELPPGAASPVMPIYRKDRGVFEPPQAQNSDSPSTTTSGANVANWQNEVEDLRREMAQIRMAQDLPPSYNS